MAQITITGYSDDLIEIEGDISEEFNWISDDGERRYLAVSDGTLLSVWYDEDGLWRFSLIARGRADYANQGGNPMDDTNDLVTLTSDDPEALRWVMFGTTKAIRK